MTLVVPTVIAVGVLIILGPATHVTSAAQDGTRESGSAPVRPGVIYLAGAVQARNLRVAISRSSGPVSDRLNSA